MCGISGIYGARGDQNYSVLVSRMLTAIEHRGPDGRGVWCESKNRCCLGHRRLAIIDLSDEGKQPMSSRDGRYALTFNGEIYNFREIRIDLEKLGAVFRGHSDTEVLVEAFSIWGLKKTLNKLVGMFSCALWDNNEKRLFLFRDRAGKKPLYYTIQRGKLWFASEIKSLRALDGLSFEINSEALGHYLSLDYIPSPLTIYKEVLEVPPGVIFSIDDTLLPKVSSYWILPVNGARRINKVVAADEVEKLLSDAISLRLRADVPVGIFLSGGIDSGLITAMAARQSDKPVQTFCAKFSESTFDESVMAREVADFYGTDHHELMLTPKLEDLLPKVAASFDEPFADPSAVPTFAIAQEASRHVKVVLNGEGSDELFGGYRRHRAMHYYSKLAWIDQCMPNFFWRACQKSLPTPRGFRTPYAFLYRFIRGFGTAGFGNYLIWGSDGFDENEKRALFGMGFGQSTEEYLAKHFEYLEGVKPMSRFMALDFLSGMADCLLVKIDIATMAHSIEGRSPFLDHRLIEWASNLDSRDLVSGIEGKPILRHLAKKYLPAETVSAPKRGFEIPLVDWTGGPLRQMIGDLCLSKNGIVQQIFDAEQIQSLVNGVGSMDAERRAKRLWKMLMLALWDESIS